MAKHQLDAHQKPPDGLKAFYKKYQRMSLKSIDEDDTIIDFSRANCNAYEKKLRVVRTVHYPMSLAQSNGLLDRTSPTTQASHSVDVFEHSSFPGGRGRSAVTITHVLTVQVLRSCLLYFPAKFKGTC